MEVVGGPFSFRLEPHQTRPLEPQPSKYEVKARGVPIAIINYPNTKKFDLDALNRVDGARFTNTVNLEA